jgi:hypothetical protein
MTAAIRKCYGSTGEKGGRWLSRLRLKAALRRAAYAWLPVELRIRLRKDDPLSSASFLLDALYNVRY